MAEAKVEEEVIDVRLGQSDEEKEGGNLGFENFLDKNKFTIGFLLVGILLLGLGVLGYKSFGLWGEGAKVEILGSETGEIVKLSNYPIENSQGKITAEIAGEVIKPGVYELEIGSRVNDLLITGGGLSANADREWVGRNINLAQKLQDGVKIFVPSKTQNSNLKTQNQNLNLKTIEGKININTASGAELDTLWGIGEATAKKIIEARPFQKPEDLLEKKIVKSNVWEAIKDKITVY